MVETQRKKRPSMTWAFLLSKSTLKGYLFFFFLTILISESFKCRKNAFHILFENDLLSTRIFTFFWDLFRNNWGYKTYSFYSLNILYFYRVIFRIWGTFSLFLFFSYLQLFMLSTIIRGVFLTLFINMILILWTISWWS